MTNDVERRLYDHNDRPDHHGWTKRYRPWELVHTEYFNLKADARNREKELKSAQGRKFIREKILTK